MGFISFVAAIGLSTTEVAAITTTQTASLTGTVLQGIAAAGNISSLDHDGIQSAHVDFDRRDQPLLLGDFAS